MKRLFDYADRYLQKSDWKDIAMIKYCLFSTGIFAGTYIQKKNKDCARIIALIGFVVTSIPIMMKLFNVITDESE